MVEGTKVCSRSGTSPNEQITLPRRRHMKTAAKVITMTLALSAGCQSRTQGETVKIYCTRDGEPVGEQTCHATETNASVAWQCDPCRTGRGGGLSPHMQGK